MGDHRQTPAGDHANSISHQYLAMHKDKRPGPVLSHKLASYPSAQLPSNLGTGILRFISIDK